MEIFKEIGKAQFLQNSCDSLIKIGNQVIFLICQTKLNQSGAWYAEAVDRAVIRKLEKIKTLQGFKKFSRWRSRRNLHWVIQRMSCKQSIKGNL